MQSLYWCFTYNNPIDNNIPRQWGDVTYAIWQLEGGEKTGTKHLQGYVAFSRRKRISTLKKLNKYIHWEVRRGSHDQAKQYASKPETRLAGPWTCGDDSAIAEQKPGKRNDLLEVKKALDEGNNDAYIMENYFAACSRNMRFFREYRRHRKPQRSFKTHVRVLWGPTGTGKSLYCLQQYPDAYWKAKSMWWDGYDGQAVVVIDEFYGWLSYDFVLRLFDRYPLILETKGGHCSFLATKIIVTSNKHPRDWFNTTRHPWEPLERRIEEIIEYPLSDNNSPVSRSVTDPPATTTTTTTSSDEVNNNNNNTTTTSRTVQSLVVEDEEMPTDDDVLTEPMDVADHDPDFGEADVIDLTKPTCLTELYGNLYPETDEEEDFQSQEEVLQRRKKNKKKTLSRTDEDSHLLNCYQTLSSTPYSSPKGKEKDTQPEDIPGRTIVHTRSQIASMAEAIAEEDSDVDNVADLAFNLFIKSRKNEKKK